MISLFGRGENLEIVGGYKEHIWDLAHNEHITCTSR